MLAFLWLDGGGAFRSADGGTAPAAHVVYAGIGFATALVEKLVRTRVGRIPKDQQMGEILVPGYLAAEEIGAADLPGWRDPGCEPAEPSAMPVRRAQTLALIVPSVPAMGYERNLLLNQLHPDFAEVTCARPRPVVWDARLFAIPS